jgi:hypothetical protein
MNDELAMLLLASSTMVAAALAVVLPGTDDLCVGAKCVVVLVVLSSARLDFGRLEVRGEYSYYSRSSSTVWYAKLRRISEKAMETVIFKRDDAVIIYP